MANMKSLKIIGFAIVCFVFVWGCKKTQEPDQVIAVGTNTPKLPNPTYQYDSTQSNQQFQFNERATLGRVLFYDKALSFNNSISCGSCHIQQLGFADNVQFHKGVYGNELKRNTLSISGNSTKLFWDGRSTSMRDLVLRPLSNHDEMLQNLTALPSKLALIEYYKKLFFDAYGDPKVTLAGIQDALAVFCEVLLPNNSKFDIELKKANGNVWQNLSGFTEQENKGLTLFFGKATCANCHIVGVNFSDFGVGGGYSPPSENIGLDMEYKDNGIGALKNDATLNGLFKVPNLKNIALTAPYMHDGRFKTLEDVIEHYNNNVVNHPNLSTLLSQLGETDSEEDAVPIRLNLTEDEKKALVAFLKTFTDESFIRDPKFSNPF